MTNRDAIVALPVDGGAPFCRFAGVGLCEPFEHAVRQCATSDQKRRIRLRHARYHGTHSADAWQWLVMEFDHCCARCGAACEDQPQKDHIVPIYIGGSDAIDNIQPLCALCNCSKGPETINHVWNYRAARP